MSKLTDVLHTISAKLPHASEAARDELGALIEEAATELESLIGATPAAAPVTEETTGVPAPDPTGVPAADPASATKTTKSA